MALLLCLLMMKIRKVVKSQVQMTEEVQGKSITKTAIWLNIQLNKEVQIAALLK